MYSVETIAIRLADEGVPLRAIARATGTPSDTLRDKLHEARDDGRLLELPREDWPPGSPRDQRALQLSRRVTQDPAQVHLAIRHVFHLTATEVTLLMLLIQSADVHRDRIDLPRKTVDVHICNIRRRLEAFNIKVTTLWGYGYQLSEPHRRKAMDLILSHMQGVAFANWRGCAQAPRVGKSFVA